RVASSVRGRSPRPSSSTTKRRTQIWKTMLAPRWSLRKALARACFHERARLGPGPARVDHRVRDRADEVRHGNALEERVEGASEDPDDDEADGQLEGEDDEGVDGEGRLRRSSAGHRVAEDDAQAEREVRR